MTKERKILLIFSIVVLGFFTSTVFHYICGAYRGMPYPLGTPLFIAADHFADFQGIRTATIDLDPFHSDWRGFGANYPPGAYLLMATFTNLIQPLGLYLYLTLFITAIVTGGFIVLRKSDLPLPKILLVIGLTLMTYPVLFNIDRTNTEALLSLITFLGLTLFIYNFRRAGAVVIGIAAACKIYPIIFLLGFGRRKIWESAAIAGLALIVFTSLALFVFDMTPIDLLDAYKRSYPSSHKLVFVGSEGIERSSSLYGMFRAVLGMLGAEWRTEGFNIDLVKYTYIITVPLLLNTIRVFFFKSMLIWESLAVAGMLVILVPQTSFDYKLIYLFPALCAFMSAQQSRDDRFVCWLFGLLLISKHYVVLFERVTIQTVLNPLLLIIFLFLIFWRIEKRGDTLVSNNLSGSSTPI